MNLLDKEHKRTKMLVQQPIPGYWYTSMVGQLQQVRIVLHEGQRQSRIVLENINGQRRTVDTDGWYRLDLTLHSPGNRRRRHGSGDSSEDSS